MGLIRREFENEMYIATSLIDKCLEKKYCKIPFIVLCIILGLIIFSTLYCFVRCCICGYNCCTCCCGGCGGRRSRREKREKKPVPPTLIVQQQPAYQPPPHYGYVNNHSNGDALPAMPMFEKTVRVEVTDHELAPMSMYGYPAGAPGLQHPTARPGYGQQRGSLSPRAPPPGVAYQEVGVVHHREEVYREPQHQQQQGNGYAYQNHESGQGGYYPPQVVHTPQPIHDPQEIHAPQPVHPIPIPVAGQYQQQRQYHQQGQYQQHQGQYQSQGQVDYHHQPRQEEWAIV